jgi:glycosyltransferase involved in cell wall biosynthesis
LISVLILTHNEEINLPDCLKSIDWCDDILVFDSGSTDKTLSIAKGKGVRILTRPFDNYGSQRQAALEQGNFKHPWLLVLDADERVDSELAVELKAVASDPSNPNHGYRIRRKDYFLGRWIPRSTLYPTWYLRFFHRSFTRYESRTVHEHPIVDGSVGRLKGHLLHYSFNKGFEDWVEKHRRYAKLEAKEALQMLSNPIDGPGLFNSDPGRRRRALKGLSYRLPFRGLMRFLFMTFIRFSFLDGWPGIRYSLLISRYESWIQNEMKVQTESLNA